MTKKLKDREWKIFQIDKLFKIKNVKGKPIENYQQGNIPYVSTASLKNGIIDFIKADKDIVSEKDAISIDPIKGRSFFHKYEFIGRGYSGASINLLYKDNINKYLALFLCVAIENTAKNKASYGYLFNSERLKNAKILLPVNSKGEPDYEFMEEYIKEKEQKLKQEYKTYIQERVAKLQKKVDMKDKEWKNFKLSKIFSFDKGNQNNMGSLQNGNIPLVSAKKVDNGYKDFVSKNNKKIFEGGCISLNNDGDGGAGIAYYQPYKMLLDSHCTALIPKLDLTKETLIFLSRAITKQRNKFGHGYAINKERLNIFQIMLPINTKGEPDYEFMHNYMLYLEQKKILEYLEYTK